MSIIKIWNISRYNDHKRWNFYHHWDISKGRFRGSKIVFKIYFTNSIIIFFLNAPKYIYCILYITGKFYNISTQGFSLRWICKLNMCSKFTLEYNIDFMSLKFTFKNFTYNFFMNSKITWIFSLIQTDYYF